MKAKPVLYTIESPVLSRNCKVFVPSQVDHQNELKLTHSRG